VAQIKIELRQAFTGDCVIEVSPNPDTLSAAAGFGKLTTAETYAVGALNIMRDLATAESIQSIRVKKPKKAFQTDNPVKHVTIEISDRADGGAQCKMSPSFNTLASLAAGGSEITDTHKYALVAATKIALMNKEVRMPIAEAVN
jgi:hypothetical protein